MMDEYRDFKTISRISVDGEPWYTIACSRAVSAWLRTAFGEHEHRQWQQHNAPQYMDYYLVDIDERIYTLLALRWS
jgi:hypothetical protein